MTQMLLLDADVPASEADFDEFWKHYPRKVSKATARRAWTKARQQHRLPSLKRLITALQLWSQCEQWKNPSYIPHPATWLNQSRWDDEPPRAISRSSYRRSSRSFELEDFGAIPA